MRELRRETDHVVMRVDVLHPTYWSQGLFDLHTQYDGADRRMPGPQGVLYESWSCYVSDRPRDSLAQKTHPRFTITCESCGSTDVVVDNTIGFSPQSGAWGSLSLDCSECGNSKTLWEPYD